MLSDDLRTLQQKVSRYNCIRRLSLFGNVSVEVCCTNTTIYRFRPLLRRGGPEAKAVVFSIPARKA